MATKKINKNDINLKASDVGAMSALKTDVLGGMTSVLQAVNAIPTSGSFMAVQGTNLCNASDSLYPGAEIHYFVLVDDEARRRVIAMDYGSNSFHIWTRRIFQGNWLDSEWCLLHDNLNLTKPTSENVDLNHLIKQGTYYLWGDNCINLPTDESTPTFTHSIVQVYEYNSVIEQILIVGNMTAYNIHAGKVYVRVSSFGTGWTEWKRLASVDEVFTINITPNQDYNNFVWKTGYYELQGNCPNNPYGSDNTDTHFYMEVFVHWSGQWVKQIAYDVRSHREFQRTLTGGNWSAWYEPILNNIDFGHYYNNRSLINTWYDANFGWWNIGLASIQTTEDVSKISINLLGLYWQRYLQANGYWETYRLYSNENIMSGNWPLASNSTSLGTDYIFQQWE